MNVSNDQKDDKPKPPPPPQPPPNMDPERKSWDPRKPAKPDVDPRKR